MYTQYVYTGRLVQVLYPSENSVQPGQKSSEVDEYVEQNQCQVGHGSQVRNIILLLNVYLQVFSSVHLHTK